MKERIIKIKSSKKKGFTLIELVVVIAIMAILALIMVPNLTAYIQKAGTAKIDANMKNIHTAAEMVRQTEKELKVEAIKNFSNIENIEKSETPVELTYTVFENEDKQVIVQYKDEKGETYKYSLELGFSGSWNLEEPAINTDPVDWYIYDESSATITGLSSLGEVNVGQELSLPNKTPEGKIVTAIGANAFNNRGLKSVTIPNSVVYIREWAFMENELTSLVIPDSVEYIGAESFRENQLAEITIPSSVTVIESAAFNNNRLPEDKAFIYARDTSGNVNTTKIVSYGGERDSVAIPDFVEIIGREAFSGTQLSSVDFSDATSLTKIEKGAFASNSLIFVSLLSSNKNQSLKTLEQRVFYGNQLEEVVIPNSIASIGEQAFAWLGVDSPSLPIEEPKYGWAGVWTYVAGASEWKKQSDTGPPSGGGGGSGGGGSVGSPN